MKQRIQPIATILAIVLVALNIAVPVASAIVGPLDATDLMAMAVGGVLTLAVFRQRRSR
jgi:hypothetical protein